MIEPTARTYHTFAATSALSLDISGVMAVFGAGDHGQASVHGAALATWYVVGDGVAQLGVLAIRIAGGLAVQRRCPVRVSASSARRTSRPPGVTASMQVAVGGARGCSRLA